MAFYSKYVDALTTKKILKRKNSFFWTTAFVLVLLLLVHRTADNLLEIVIVVIGQLMVVHSTAINTRNFSHTKNDNAIGINVASHICSALFQS